jgi:hypothetical protein
MAGRYELKYAVDGLLRARLAPIIAAYMVPDEHAREHGSYPVLSQYYDGPDLPFYLDKVAGLERRTKVRLRTYGWQFDDTNPWFLEIKKKENASIAKLRVRVDGAGVDPSLPASWGEVDGRLLALRALVRLEPTAGVWYEREAYVSPSGDLRVTWDDCVRALYPGEAMSRRFLYDSTREAVPDRYSVLEIKSAQNLPHWLSDLIRDSNLTTEAVSKYVLAMNALGLSRRVLSTC